LGLGFTAAHWIINTKDDNFRTGKIVASSSTQPITSVGGYPGWRVGTAGSSSS